MYSAQKCQSQRLLESFVAASIKGSSKTLSLLQELTGINRSTLGRMRLGQHPVSVEQAEAVFRAVDRPARALIMLACLGEDSELSADVLAYIEQFLSNMPTLIERLNELGSSLNPKWALGSVHHVALLMAQHADRRRQADIFPSP